MGAKEIIAQHQRRGVGADEALTDDAPLDQAFGFGLRIPPRTVANGCHYQTGAGRPANQFAL
jgi:hypothetical protein